MSGTWVHEVHRAFRVRVYEANFRRLRICSFGFRAQGSGSDNRNAGVSCILDVKTLCAKLYY